MSEPALQQEAIEPVPTAVEVGLGPTAPAEQAPAEAAMVEPMSTQELVRTYKDMVYAIALTHTDRRPDADDVFQEVFLAYHRKQPQFPSEERRKAWLIVTTINCARQIVGSSWSRKVIPFAEQEGEAPSDDTFRFASDDQDLVFQALQKLPDSYRTVLFLFYFEDLPVAQIAATLGMQPGTIRVQLSRARAQIRSLLKGAYFNEG